MIFCYLSIRVHMMHMPNSNYFRKRLEILLEILQKAYLVIRTILNSFRNHDCTFYLKMYTTYVRPILEYCSQVWSPPLKQNIDRVENVQRYFTRRILHNDMSYLERCNFLKLEMLEERRIKADLVMYFKCMNNFTEFCTNDIFRYNGTRRGHDKQLFVFYSRTEKRQFYWSNRLVSNWNRLPQIVVNNTSVYGFKRSLRMVNFIGRGSAYCFN